MLPTEIFLNRPNSSKKYKEKLLTLTPVFGWDGFSSFSTSLYLWLVAMKNCKKALSSDDFFHLTQKWGQGDKVGRPPFHRKSTFFFSWRRLKDNVAGITNRGWWVFSSPLIMMTLSRVRRDSSSLEFRQRQSSSNPTRTILALLRIKISQKLPKRRKCLRVSPTRISRLDLAATTSRSHLFALCLYESLHFLSLLPSAASLFIWVSWWGIGSRGDFPHCLPRGTDARSGWLESPPKKASGWIQKRQEEWA